MQKFLFWISVLAFPIFLLTSCVKHNDTAIDHPCLPDWTFDNIALTPESKDFISRFNPITGMVFRDSFNNTIEFIRTTIEPGGKESSWQSCHFLDCNLGRDSMEYCIPHPTIGFSYSNDLYQTKLGYSIYVAGSPKETYPFKPFLHDAFQVSISREDYDHDHPYRVFHYLISDRGNDPDKIITWPLDQEDLTYNGFEYEDVILYRSSLGPFGALVVNPFWGIKGFQKSGDTTYWHLDHYIY